jgi:hypothetical protein
MEAVGSNNPTSGWWPTGESPDSQLNGKVLHLACLLEILLDVQCRLSHGELDVRNGSMEVVRVATAV